MKSKFLLHPIITLAILILASVLPNNYVSGEALPTREIANNKDPIPAEFINWYNSGNNKIGYMEFENFLKSENVYGIFPTWQLLLSDTEYVSPLCQSNKFVLPPKRYWKNSVKTIKFIKQNIIPKIGKVRIVSGFRPSDFNKCIGGAAKSKHLEFGAFDLVSIDRDTNDKLFNDLCEIWRRTNDKFGFGFGAYWNKLGRISNPNGRFHIDTFGKRTWGLDYKSGTSFCLVSKTK